MSLSGAHTYDDTYDEESSLSAGANAESRLTVAPLGFGAEYNLLGADAGITLGKGKHFSTSATRASDSHYQYSFNFEYDFSTSSDPFIAGAASDVIIGGGVDLVVNEAIEGFKLLPGFILLLSFLR